MDDVRLPELEVIQRFSLAVRAEYAPAADVIEALKSDLARLTADSTPAKSASKPKSRAKKSAAKSTTRRSTR